MFERYTEKARRVIFFARYEASQFGSPYIETEHLLLGLLREDKALTNRFLRSHASVESIRKQIEGHTTIREKVSTSVDLPLSNECKRVLAYAAEEAERLSHKHIGTEHLLLGLLREEKCFAAEILHERGLRLSTIFAPPGLWQPADADHQYGHGNADVIAAFLVAVIILVISLAIIWNLSGTLVARLSVIPLGLAFGAAAGSYFLRAMRLYLLLVRSGVPISLPSTLLAQAVGLALSITPAAAGEVLKLRLIQERAGAPILQTAPVFILETASSTLPRGMPRP